MPPPGARSSTLHTCATQPPAIYLAFQQQMVGRGDTETLLQHKYSIIKQIHYLELGEVLSDTIY